MDNDDKLTREMVFCLIFIGILGNIVYCHTWIDDAAGRSAWLAGLAGILCLIPFALWILYVGQLSKEATVFDMVEKGMGKIVCAGLCVPFILINVLVAVTELNMFTEMVKVFFLPLTPVWLIMLIVVLISVIIINRGLTMFARLVEMLTLLGLLNYFVSFLFAFPNNFNLYYILPVFDTSWPGFIKGAFFITGEASECLLLLMIIVRFIPDPFRHHKWVSYGIAATGVVFSVAILFIMAMMSPELAKRIAFGGINAAKLLQVGEYVRGLEIFIFGTYDFLAVGKVSLCLYCSRMAMQKIFGTKKKSLQLSALAILIFAPALWISSYSKAYFLAVFMGSYVILPFVLLVLILASVSIAVKNKTTGSVAS